MLVWGMHSQYFLFTLHKKLVEFEIQQFQEALLHGQQLMRLVQIGNQVETLRLVPVSRAP